MTLAIIVAIAFAAGWLTRQYTTARALRRTAARTRVVLQVDRVTGAATYCSPFASLRLGIVGQFASNRARSESRKAVAGCQTLVDGVTAGETAPYPGGAR